MAKTSCGVEWECPAGYRSQGPEIPGSPAMSVNAAIVGGTTVMGAAGSEVLMGGYVVPEWIKAQALHKV